MDLNQSNPRYLRVDGLHSPAPILDLKQIDSLLVLLEHRRLGDCLGNILTCAAVHRAIALERGAAPELNVLREGALNNVLSGSGDVPLLRKIRPGTHALLLTGATLYNRQMACIAGVYAVAGATLEAFPSLADDMIPIGRRQDPKIEVASYVSQSLERYEDQWIRTLLAIVRGEATHVGDTPIHTIQKAIAILQDMELPWVRKERESAPDLTASVRTMILEWGSGTPIPSNVRPLIERYEESKVVAAAMWQESEQIAPGVYVIVAPPTSERDEVIQRLLRDAYNTDPNASVILERNEDRPANALHYDESVDFERRLGAGESAEEILAEVEALLTERNDTSSLLSIELKRGRDRDPSEILKPVLTEAQYIPDESGYCYTMLKGPDEDRLYNELQRVAFPLIAHGQLWMHNLAAGTARPVTLSFQSKDLQQFLDVVASVL